jgi:hypothetical protein
MIPILLGSIAGCLASTRSVSTASAIISTEASWLWSRTVETMPLLPKLSTIAPPTPSLRNSRA